LSDGAKRSNLELARVLIPPEGNDWGEIASSNRAEAAFLERVDPHLHDGFETVWRHTTSESETHAGVDEVLGALRRVGRGFESLVAVPERFIDLGDRVLVLLSRRGRTVTGLDFDEPGAALYVIEDGKLRQMVLYANQELAFTDLGLDESDATRRGVASDDLPMPPS
jgi:ketosteroid isomerase-like protein